MTTPFDKVTPYDEFNLEVPENEFPKSGISARAAEAIVISDEWTDALCDPSEDPPQLLLF